MLEQLPEDIRNNTHLKSYIIYNELIGKYAVPIFAAERIPDERDEPAIVGPKGVIKEPVYYGNWVDCTEEHQRASLAKQLKIKEEDDEQMKKLREAIKRLRGLRNEED